MRGQSHQTFFAAMGVVLVAKGDLVVLEGDQAMIGNGDPVGVAGEVAQDMLHRGHRRGGFEIDDPVLPKQGAQEGGEGWRLAEGLERSERVSWGWLFSKASTNLPRKTRLSTWRGRKRSGSAGESSASDLEKVLRLGLRNECAG